VAATALLEWHTLVRWLRDSSCHWLLPPVQGWSPERAKRFGAALLPAVYEVLPSLRSQ
jgi:hypothetical protein